MKTGSQVERVALNAFFHAKRVGGSALHLMLASLLATTASAAEIRVVGSDLLGEGFARAVAQFARENDTGVKLDLRGTRPGTDDLVAARADVGIFLLPAAEIPPSGSVVSRTIGYQVTVVAVPVASPLTQVTLAQLRAIFGAEGTKERTTFAVSPQAGLAWSLFQRVILQDAPPRVALEFSPSGSVLAQRLRAVENSIGVVGIAAAGNGGLRMLAVAAGPTEPAFLPTAENVHAGNYPMRLVLYVSFPRTKAPELQRFLKFLLSDDTAAALAPADFVPLPVGARNQLVFELEEMR
jgi:phosphate transport system substrate-binding protein